MSIITGRHSRGYLPHLKVESAAYFVTFRLSDSLPRAVLARLEEIRADRARRVAAESTPPGDAEYSSALDDHLDGGSGACWLRHPRIAQLVADSMRHFNSQRYQLSAWVVMPNHVHAVVQPLSGFALEQILHSWKSFSAKRANEMLGRSGVFWQPESYDHWIRDELEFSRFKRYIEENPVKARLVAKPEDWRWSSAWRGSAVS